MPSLYFSLLKFKSQIKLGCWKFKSWCCFRWCITAWVRLESANSALIRATLQTEKETYNCIGTVLAKRGCWSFLKGGFVLNSSSTISILFFQVHTFTLFFSISSVNFPAHLIASMLQTWRIFLLLQTADGGDISIALASPSLQPFTKQQWRMNQEYIINTVRDCVYVFSIHMGAWWVWSFEKSEFFFYG